DPIHGWDRLNGRAGVPESGFNHVRQPPRVGARVLAGRRLADREQLELRVELVDLDRLERGVWQNGADVAEPGVRLHPKTGAKLGSDGRAEAVEAQSLRDALRFGCDEFADDQR